MKTIRILLPVILFGMLLIYGCTNQETGDAIPLTDFLFGASDSIKTFQESEGYDYLPSDVKGIVAIIAIGLSSIGNAILAFKANKQKKVLEEIVFENGELTVKTPNSRKVISTIRKANPE